MDRKLLIELFRMGMRYRPGKHRIWVSRCFEITVRSNQVVELNEYEGIVSEDGASPKRIQPAKTTVPEEMFHVSRSILHLKNGHLAEEPGSGWPPSSPKVNDDGKK